MENKLKYIFSIFLSLCLMNTYSYTEIGFNSQFFDKHRIRSGRMVSNIQTNNIYFSIGKYYKRDSNYRYFLGLGALPQHVKISNYDVYEIHNIWHLGVARSIAITKKNRVSIFLNLRSSFLGTWKLGNAFPNYQNKSSTLDRNDYFEFFHNKGLELGMELNLLPPKLKSKLNLSGSVEYKFDKPRLPTHSYGIVEGNVFYYSLGINYRHYFRT